MIDKCPKCTAPSPNGTSCPRCGLIFANWKPEKAPLPMEPLRAAAPKAPLVPPLAIAGGATGLVLLLLVFVVVRSCGGGAAPPAVALEGAGGVGGAGDEEVREAFVAAEGQAPVRKVPEAAWAIPTAEAVLEAGALPAPLDRGGVSVAWLTGADGFQRGTDEQREALAPLLALVTSGSCASCKRLDDEILPAVEGELRDVIKVRIVPAGSAEEQAVATRVGGGDGALWLTPFPGDPAVRLSVGPSEPPDRLPERLKAELQRAAAARFTRATALKQQGELAAALRLLHEAVVLDPELSGAYTLRGIVYERAGETGRAMTELQNALAQGTDQPEARERLALLYLRADRNDDALSVLDPLLRLAPRYGKGRAHWLRAVTWQRKGDEEKAWNDVRDACNLGHSRACGLLK